MICRKDLNIAYDGDSVHPAILLQNNKAWIH